MAKLRSASAYRRLKRAYTRHSRVRAKSFIKGAPGKRVVLYDMGNVRRKFPYEVQLISLKNQNLRDNAIESGRMTTVRYMDKTAGKEMYNIKVRAVPHHILRENPLATGAGADRFQTGMSMSFGKPIGHAAQVRKGKIIFSIGVEKQHIVAAKEACRKAKSKFGIRCSILTKELATGKITT